MSEVAVHIQDISKAYRHYSSLIKRVFSWFSPKYKPASEIKVVEHVSFDIYKGDCVALIGQNGAGKSTLLKIIAGTIFPTSGVVNITGSVSSILELGMGFNPQLTGKDNVYHVCTMMGHSRDQIDNMVSSILDFSELGSYFDEPIRTYSSGMQARLAFSVATAVRPDILIVDEALSVGDTYFQHKSFARMKQFANQGTTLLFVSHDMGAVKTLCNRAILLEKGRMIKDGPPEEVADYYNAIVADKEASGITINENITGKLQTVHGTGEATVEDIYLLNESGEKIDFVSVGQPLKLVVRAHIHENLPQLVLGYVIKDRLGQEIYGTNTFHTEQVLCDVQKGDLYHFEIDFSGNLGPGSYSISTALVSSDTHLFGNHEWKDLACVFEVGNLSHPTFVGNAWIPPQIRLERVS